MAKKVSKKSLEYVRPEPGTFTLVAFPGVDFRFRKVTIDDEAWCIDRLGKTPWQMINADTEKVSELCQLYFHQLEDRFKEHFVPVVRESRDYETGEMKKEMVPGSRLFMQAIDGGTRTELLSIHFAFTKTVMSSRPLEDLPDEVKKSLLRIAARKKAELEKASKTEATAPPADPNAK